MTTTEDERRLGPLGQLGRFGPLRRPVPDAVRRGLLREAAPVVEQDEQDESADAPATLPVEQGRTRAAHCRIAMQYLD
ncbi:hypothetical protein P3T36_004075 [Kitasatospora sp. MAP12-15]|uniref:hypothetical protein n=1 Tax=unclassified Kitasatospora TaxID=2633591 RepID=UPI0024749C42|nr:hypothetical protein [Kitasatospora sp. MAP12-44]MDH6115156.1 hypothetical protein [Kitasatospora sp. MAP12-44]